MARLPVLSWSAYDVWNSALCEVFFSGRWAGRPVYLDLEGPVLERLGAAQTLSTKSMRMNSSRDIAPNPMMTM